MANSSDDTGSELIADILLVDDDHPAMDRLGKGLREAGYSVRVAATGAEAMLHCDEQAPELAMLGTRLPDMPGRKVALDLRERRIPFLFLCSPADDDVVKETIEVGAFSYLCKPLEVDKLVSVIQAALLRGAEDARSAPVRQSSIAGTYSAREISVAIGVIMERHRLTADEAFEALRRHARSQRRKIVEVASQVIRASEDINILVKSAASRGRTGVEKSSK